MDIIKADGRIQNLKKSHDALVIIHISKDMKYLEENAIMTLLCAKLTYVGVQCLFFSINHALVNMPKRFNYIEVIFQRALEDHRIAIDEEDEETKEGTSFIHQISGEKMLCLFLKRHLQLLPFMNGWPVLRKNHSWVSFRGFSEAYNDVVRQLKGDGIMKDFLQNKAEPSTSAQIRCCFWFTNTVTEKSCVRYVFQWGIGI
ncbi:uncharacterized protein LOC144438617 isoform X1 [Glandiceps talaboti]